MMKFALASTNYLLAFLSLVSYRASLVHGGQIKLCVQAAENQTLKDIHVKCYDEDPTTNDDLMTEGVTESNGCVTMEYETKTYPWYKCINNWDGCSPGYWEPDIYCRIDEDCLQPYQTGTEYNWDQTKLVDFGSVSLQQDGDYCHGIGYNGCGSATLPPWLTQSMNQVSGFAAACHDHDLCYARPICTSTTRSHCDTQFLNDMYDQCDDVNGGWFCDFLAETFYNAVDTFGGDLWCPP